jgi:hypothetical protein
LKRKSFVNIEEGMATTRQSSKQRRKKQPLSIILEEKSGEDLAIFKREISTHHMDIMGHVIHILHTYFILVY